MPYLLILGPEFPFEQRKIMAVELTDAIMEALAYPEFCRDWITVHFVAYQPDQVSVGGRLLSEREERNYYCQYFDGELSTAKKQKMTDAIFPLLMEQLGLDGSQARQIKFLFQNYPYEDIVIGGLPLAELLGVNSLSQ